jgi:hypothetical protein
MKLILLFIIFFCSVCLLACSRGDVKKLDYDMVGGYVVGREHCHSDTTQDYWLVDLSAVAADNRKFGDTLRIGGWDFYKLVKTKQLAPEFKYLGAKVMFGAKWSRSRVTSNNCDVASPVTYSLIEMKIVDQFELR